MNTPTDSPAAHYVEVILLDGDEAQRARHIAQAVITPCLAATQDMDDMPRLRFWLNLVAHLLGQAEASVGADGRMAIVQCMRTVPPATHCAPGVVQ